MKGWPDGASGCSMIVGGGGGAVWPSAEKATTCSVVRRKECDGRTNLRRH